MSRPAAERPRIRELRLQRGWTQQELAERIIRRSKDKQIGVTADTISKWERGAKGVSGRYRALLAAEFAVTIDQLGLPGLARGGGQHRANPSLISIVDQAAELLDQLGNAGRAVRPQVLAALTENVLSRRSVLAFIDTPPRAPAPPSPDDLDALAERYAEAFGRAEPATLLTALGAHLRMVADALSLDPPTGTRQRLLRNRLRIGIIAGQLSEDIENPMAARAHYMQATDDAYEVDDHTAAAVAHGYSARLAVHERQPLAALRHLDRSAELATRDSAVRSWLAGIEAAAHAMLGHHAAAEDARGREEALGRAAGGTVVWFAGGTASRLPTAS